MVNKKLDYEKIGSVEFKKYKKAKYLKIKVKETGEVSVSMPYFVTYSEAENFVQEKSPWILKEQEKFKSLKQQIKLVYGDSKYLRLPERKQTNQPEAFVLDFKTKYREVELIFCEVSKTTYRLSSNKLKIYFPLGTDLGLEATQDYIREKILFCLRKEAHAYLPLRVQELAEAQGLNYRGLSIRDTKTRWGSCTADNKLNLSIQLLKLPDELIDYVILHELTHTIEKNHSKNFWDRLSMYLGQDAKSVDKKLRVYSSSIEFA